MLVSDINMHDEKELLVFLGGSCNPTTWREKIVIPFLLNHKIQFFNPVEKWSQDLIESEEAAKKNAFILFFVIDDQTRAISSMVETAYLASASKQKLISVINLPSFTAINMKDEHISARENEMLKKSRNFLFQLIRSNNLPVFFTINAALEELSRRIFVCHFKSTINNYPIDDDLPKINRFSLQLHNHSQDDQHSSRASDSGVLTLSDVISLNSCNTDHDLFIDSNRSSFQCKLTHHPHRHHLHSFNINTYQLHTSPNGSHKLYLFLTKQLRYLRSLISISRSSHANNLSAFQSKNDLSSSPAHLDVSFQNLSHHDITLLGPGRWKNRIAIPLIRNAGFSYKKANAKALFWPKNPTRLSFLIRQLKAAKLLLFVISDYDLALETLILASHCIGLKYQVFLCVQMLNTKSIHKKYQISRSGLNDYNRGRAYLTSIAQREGIKVFSSIQDAVENAIKSLK